MNCVTQGTVVTPKCGVATNAQSVTGLSKSRNQEQVFRQLRATYSNNIMSAECNIFKPLFCIYFA